MVVGILVVVQGDRAVAQPDLSGDWDLNFVQTVPGPAEFYCAAVIAQEGGSLQATTFCPELSSPFQAGAFTGTVDEAGAFLVTGTWGLTDVSLSGTLSQDGQAAVDGSWAWSGLALGTFTATRSNGFGDVDGDGCATEDERDVDPGSEMAGGQRDPLDPYDYFNPTGDGQNRVDDVMESDRPVLHRLRQSRIPPGHGPDAGGSERLELRAA
jgi:hypothetical protein